MFTCFALGARILAASTATDAARSGRKESVRQAVQREVQQPCSHVLDMSFVVRRAVRVAGRVDPG